MLNARYASNFIRGLQEGFDPHYVKVIPRASLLISLFPPDGKKQRSHTESNSSYTLLIFFIISVYHFY